MVIATVEVDSLTVCRTAVEAAVAVVVAAAAVVVAGSDEAVETVVEEVVAVVVVVAEVVGRMGAWADAAAFVEAERVEH